MNILKMERISNLRHFLLSEIILRLNTAWEDISTEIQSTYNGLCQKLTAVIAKVLILENLEYRMELRVLDRVMSMREMLDSSPFIFNFTIEANHGGQLIEAAEYVPSY